MSTSGSPPKIYRQAAGQKQAGSLCSAERNQTILARPANCATHASDRWSLIQRHCELAVQEWGSEDQAIRSMRARLMAYSKGLPNSKALREKFQHVDSLAGVVAITQQNLDSCLQLA